ALEFIINLAELKKLLQRFYTLTHIRIVVLNADLVEVASYPNSHSAYCRILRRDPVAREKCRDCDMEACRRARRTGSTEIYRCHAGLTESVTPIRHDGAVIGYLMLGQVLQNGEGNLETWQNLSQAISRYDVDMEALREAFLRKKSYSSEVIRAAAGIMEACAGYLYLSKMIVLKNDSLSRKIDAYIRNNLAGELDAITLCDRFGISKNRLYEISDRSFGGGIAEYVRSLRVAAAKQKLTESNAKIRDIAAECGFPDYNYFTKVFKAHTGLTPRDYRKNLR
ncbi:MAG: PocR ligand-binding domain-containing protein, partial [Eubacteriales bacterium]|nr:PocR ligand-binding domain-containing protein [Eubacteriales bacterium]